MSNQPASERRLTLLSIQRDTISDSANALRTRGVRVCSFENLVERATQPLQLRDVTVSKALDVVVQRNPGYQWEAVGDELFNLYPQQSVLDSHVSLPDSTHDDASRFLLDDVKIERFGISLFTEFAPLNVGSLNLAAESGSLRGVLNALVLRMPRTVWHISGMEGAYNLSFTVVEGS